MSDLVREFCRAQEGKNTFLSVLLVDGTVNKGQVREDRFAFEDGSTCALPIEGETRKITVYGPDRNLVVAVLEDEKSRPAVALFNRTQELHNEATKAASERQSQRATTDAMADAIAVAISSASEHRDHLSREADRATSERADIQSRLDNAALAFDRASEERARSQAQLEAAQEEIRRGQAERAALQQQLNDAAAAAAAAAVDSAHAASERASLQQQIKAASDAAASAVANTTSHRTQIEDRFASLERSQSRAASPDPAAGQAASQAIQAASRASNKADRAFQEAQETTSALSSVVARLSAIEGNASQARDALDSRLHAMEISIPQLFAKVEQSITNLTNQVGSRAAPINVSSSSDAPHVSYVSSTAPLNDSSILLQEMVNKSAEVVGTIGHPRGVKDPFLPEDIFRALASLPHGYRWPRAGAMGEKFRSALADMAILILGTDDGSGGCPRARAEKSLRDAQVRLNPAEWLVFREGSLQSALELAVSKKRKSDDLLPLFLAARHPRADVTCLQHFASGASRLNGDELWGGIKKPGAPSATTTEPKGKGRGGGVSH